MSTQYCNAVNLEILCQLIRIKMLFVFAVRVEILKCFIKSTRFKFQQIGSVFLNSRETSSGAPSPNDDDDNEDSNYSVHSEAWRRENGWWRFVLSSVSGEIFTRSRFEVFLKSLGFIVPESESVRNSFKPCVHHPLPPPRTKILNSWIFSPVEYPATHTCDTRSRTRFHW